MFKPHFFAVYSGGVQPVVFEGAAQWDMYSALVLGFSTTNNYMATYIADSTSNIFNGGVNWHNPLFEAASYTAHYMVGTSGVGAEVSIRGVKQYNGYMNCYNGPTYQFVDTDATAALPYNLYDCDFVGAKNNTGNTGIVSCDVITLGRYDDRFMKLEVTNTGFISRADIGRIAADSEFSQTHFGVPLQVSGTVAPATGYYPKNSICWNEDPSLSGYIGWICTTSGSPGTWRTFGYIDKYNSNPDGNLLIQSASNNAVAASGTLDLQVGSTSGSGFQGFVIVTNTLNSNTNSRTHTTFSLFSRGTDASIQTISTDNGTTSGAAFTLSVPSNGIIRVTNNTASTCSVYIQYFGGSSL